MTPDLNYTKIHNIRRPWLVALCFLISLTGACTTTPESGIDYPGVNAQDLLVVDCLLPPQVRQLGIHLTYLAQRRAIRTSGADCALRGGDFVAYNRADFKSALAIWLPLAKQGDPEAQTYVGEIHEKGRGTRQSHELAAGWYQRAADQNYSRAQINLGYLYESGLGVERDLTKALNLYRQASGFTAAELEFVSNREIENRKGVIRQNQGLQAQVQLLQSEIRAGRQQLQTQEAQLFASKNALLELRETLANQKLSATDDLDKRQYRQRKDHEIKLEALQNQLIRTFNQKQTLQDQLTRQNVTVVAVKDQLTETQKTLTRVRQELETNRQLIDKLENQNMIREDDMRSSGKALKKARNEAAALTRKITVLESNSQRQVDNYQTMVQEATQSNATLVRQIDHHKTTIEEIEQQRKNQIAVYQQQLIERDSQLTHARLENQQLKDQNHAQQANEALQVRKLQQDIRKRESELARQATAINELKIALSAKVTSESRMRSAREVDSDSPKNPRLPLENVALGNYHALIIGNNSYKSLSDLKTAGNDAIAVERILHEKYGFRTVLLLDANQKTILSALERLRVSLGPQDNLVIYYAGHGELDKKSGRGYWLPVDSDITNKNKWIANSAITAIIDTMSAKHVLVIADSCYSGYLTRSSIARPLSGVSADLRLKWLKAVTQSRVRTVLSSGGIRPVLDGSTNSRHSIFAGLFLDTLERNTEILETYELFVELQQKVTVASARLNVEQVPQYAPIRHAGHQAGEFIFAPIAQTTVGATKNHGVTADE